MADLTLRELATCVSATVEVKLLDTKQQNANDLAAARAVVERIAEWLDEQADAADGVACREGAIWLHVAKRKLQEIAKEQTT